MFVRDSFMFIIYTTCLTVVKIYAYNTVDEHCFLHGINPTDGRETILGTVQCDSYYQECCESGCCPKANKTYNTILIIVVIVVVLVFIAIFAYFMYRMKYIRSRGRNNDRSGQRNERSTPYSPTPLTSIDNVQSENTNDLLSDRARSHNINIMGSQPRVPSAPQEQLTPPPSYDTALAAPCLNPNDRIPSYEDVMNGRSKTFL